MTQNQKKINKINKTKKNCDSVSRKPKKYKHRIIPENWAKF